MSEQRLLDMWLPPEGAGEPIACLATSFTFDTDFFRDDCLSRFLGLRSSIGEESGGLLAQIGELEESLSDVQVSVIVDRSARVEGRNLRWDVLSVSNPGGLLHAKTAVLIWRNLTRVIIGSANLTPAGYRYQREIAVALDIGSEATVPRKFWTDYSQALRSIIELAPTDLVASGPRGRAESVLRALNDRLDTAQYPREQRDISVHLIASQPGVSVTDQIRALIRTTQPRYLRAMSPFWDGDDQGAADAVRALTDLLASTGQADADLLVPLEAAPDGTIANAPGDLAARKGRKGVNVDLLGVTDGSTEKAAERRRLHAKLLSVESDEYRITMFGSSNMTASGLGLHPSRGHYEMNVCYVTPTRGPVARELQGLFPSVSPIDDSITFNVVPDVEDEPAQPPLPLGFHTALLERVEQTWHVVVGFDPQRLPHEWSVSTGLHAQPVVTSEEYSGSPAVRVQLLGDVLPQSLLVTWTDAHGDSWVADWVINVANPAELPLDERLRAIPIDLIVEVLAQGSRNPVAAIERLLERLSSDGTETGYEDLGALDPLKAFDDSRALLRRIRTYSRALDQLADRLARPAPTLSALGWRLSGLVSPVRLAEGWIEQALQREIPPEMAHFLLAELLLVINRTDWESVTAGLDHEQARATVNDMRTRVDTALGQLPPLDAANPLREYVGAVRSLA